MNKRELIEHINNTLFDNLKDTFFTEPTFSITESAKDNKVAITFETEKVGVLVGGMLKKFEKVTIPRFIADWITKAKTEGLKRKNSLGSYEELFPSDSAYSAMFSIFIKGFAIGEVRNWVAENTDTFALAWINGYEIEKEKRYRVSLKNGQPLLKAYLGKALYFSQDIAIESYKVTRKELEEAGFGWVFDCPGVEVEGVTE